MKVLVLYHFINQKNLMHNYAARLKTKGVDVDAICVDTFDYDHCTKVWWPFFLKRASFLLGLFKSIKLDQHYLSFLKYHYLLRLINKYDLVDLNAYYGDYTHIVKKCISDKKKFIVTLWGSDLMRADEAKLRDLKYSLDNCACIKLSDSLYEVLCSKFGKEYDAKCRITYFGNSDLEVIDSLDNQECVSLKRELYGNNSDKIIVVCGYNAIEHQNHKSIIDSLASLDLKYTDQCLFVFPMTYGKNRNGYKDEIRNQLDAYGLNYTILEEFLDSRRLAALRKTSDIVINIQSTDAMSASLQDHLYCGNVCIIGEWLLYKPYEDNDVFYLKCNKENLTSIFKDAFNNLEDYRQKCLNNHLKIGNFFSWEKTLDGIANTYLTACPKSDLSNGFFL